MGKISVNDISARCCISFPYKHSSSNNVSPIGHRLDGNLCKKKYSINTHIFSFSDFQSRSLHSLHLIYQYRSFNRVIDDVT